MKTFVIEEYGGSHLAHIEARTAKSALRKAARDFPRTSDSYHGVGTVEWVAYGPGDRHPVAVAQVRFPSRGVRGIVRIA